MMAFELLFGRLPVSESPILPPATKVSFEALMWTGLLRFGLSEMFCEAWRETLPDPAWMFPKKMLPEAKPPRLVLLVSRALIVRSLWLVR